MVIGHTPENLRIDVWLMLFFLHVFVFNVFET